MTATANRPAPETRTRARARGPAVSDEARLTLVIAAGLLLTTLPLHSVFTDWTWLLTTVGCAAPYWLVVYALRRRSHPSWWHSLLGLLGSLLVASWIFLPAHLTFGLLPSRATPGDARALVSQAKLALRVEHAPVASTPALRAMTSVLLTLLAALTDILAVGLRRPLLAGAPMLEILAVSSTTSSKAAAPATFVAACLGFLLILLAGTRLQDSDWGPAVDGSAGRLGGLRVLTALGIIAALAIPVVLPGRSANLLAKAAHHSSGDGQGGQITLTNLASLSGDLRRGNPVALLRIQVDPGTHPFYVRQSVLDVFNNSGWVSGAQYTGQRGKLSDETFDEAIGDPVAKQVGPPPAVQTLHAQFTVLGLGGQNLPLLSNPTSMSTSASGVWDPNTETVGATTINRNLSYSEYVAQPDPSKQDLLDAADTGAGLDLSPDLALPRQPASVTELAKKLTAGKATPYEKALAISDYFTDGQNGFVYSLDAPAADGRDAIVTFLDKKEGFCQQYAAAAAVLMRSAGIPSRVVIGYTHSAPDATGTFTVSTQDAHAWVETFFDGIGWVPFDPTPLSGADATRVVSLPYAEHTTAPPSSPSIAVSQPAPNAIFSRPVGKPQPVAAAPTTVTTTHHGSLWPLWYAASAAAVLWLLCGSVAIRRRQRRRRSSAALRDASAEPLWRELAAAALDHDVLWPDTLTVRQVPGWLSRHGLDERGTVAVVALAGRVERARFGAPPTSANATTQAADIATEVAGFDEAMTRWARRVERRHELLFGWLPRSLVRSGRANLR